MAIKKGDFIIFPARGGWIVYNTNKEFKDGHTHLRSYLSAMTIVDFVVKEKIPRKNDLYYLISMSRISNNPEFVGKVLQLVEVRKAKGKKEKCIRR